VTTKPEPRTYVDDDGLVHVLSDGVNDPQILFKWRAYQPASPWAKKDGWRALPHAMTVDDAQRWAQAERIDYDQHLQPTDEAGVIEPLFPLASWGSPDSRGRP
jgi:hypothetical protein